MTARVLRAPEAREVAIAGTFTGWKPAELLRETAPGVWTALVPLSSRAAKIIAWKR